MNDGKKIIVVGYCIAMATASIYVPWKIDIHMGGVSTALSRGYWFLTSPPVRVATIDYGKVFLELVAISAVAAVLYVLSGQFAEKLGIFKKLFAVQKNQTIIFLHLVLHRQSMHSSPVMV